MQFISQQTQLRISPGTCNTGEKKRRRQCCGIGRRVTTAVAATTCVLSLSLVSAFQSSSPFLHHYPLSQQRSSQPSIRRHVVTEPDALLLEALSKNRRSNMNAEIERLYQMSASEDEQFYPYSELQLHQLQLEEEVKRTASDNNDANNKLLQQQQQQEEQQKVVPSRQPVQFRGLSTTARKRKSPPSVPSSRSSTMPGFAAKSDKQRAYADGIRLAERRSGRKFIDTREAKQKSRKANSEAMYHNSVAVPDSMIQFADEIHREDRISRREEIELGTKTQEAVRLQNLYDVLRAKLNREPSDEEWCAAAGKINMEAIKQAIEEGLDAKNKLVTSNLRMVQSVVNTYIRNGLSSQYNAGDMMQEGIIALIRAAEKFEPDRGWKFSTYAMYWVRASVKRSQIYQSRTVTVPQRLHEKYKRLLRIQAELTLELGRKPTRAEMGAVIGMSELQVDRCFEAMQQRCFSLDQKVTNTHKPMQVDSNHELIELIDSKSDSGEYEGLERVFLVEDLIETLHRHLSPEEVELLLLRYGLAETPSNQILNNKQLTIAELSRTVGLKPDKVRRMIKKSLDRLQHVGPEEWAEFQRMFQ